MQRAQGLELAVAARTQRALDLPLARHRLGSVFAELGLGCLRFGVVGRRWIAHTRHREQQVKKGGGGILTVGNFPVSIIVRTYGWLYSTSGS